MNRLPRKKKGADKQDCYFKDMTSLLEQALARVGHLPADEQDSIAAQILDSLADEEAWKRRFTEKKDVLRRLAQEALEEDARGETRSLDELI